MKKRILKHVCCLLTAIGMLGMECMAVGAAELPQSPLVKSTDISQYDTDGDGLVYAVIGQADTMAEGLLVNQPEISLASVSNGEVIDNGVRLRKSATINGTVLELMYRGEEVYIDYTKSYLTSGWYYLKRIKTGTWGWASTSYIDYYYD